MFQFRIDKNEFYLNALTYRASQVRYANYKPELLYFHRTSGLAANGLPVGPLPHWAEARYPGLTLAAR